MRESVFTLPHADCPHPEHWSAADGDSTEQEVSIAVAGLIRGLQPSFVVETGTAFGQTAHAIGIALRNNGHGHLVSLETDADRCATAVERCRGLPVSIFAASSLEWIPTQKIGFMWLDSLPHLRGAELRRFAEYAGADCVVGVHDTTTHADPIRRDLDLLVADGIIEPPLYLPTPRGVCFTRIRKEAS